MSNVVALEELKTREEEIQQQLEELLIQEEALQESERRFRSLLENTRLIAVVLDREGRVTFCNDYFPEITGRQEKEVIGQDFFNMLFPWRKGLISGNCWRTRSVRVKTMLKPIPILKNKNEL